MAVLVVAFIVTAGLLIFVVPQFQSLFSGFRSRPACFNSRCCQFIKLVFNPIGTLYLVPLALLFMHLITHVNVLQILLIP